MAEWEERLANRKYDFSFKVDDFVAKSKEKMLAVVKNSIQDLVIEAEQPVGQGGKMRVDTGFLRQSGVASVNELPSGLSVGRKRKKGEEGVLPEYKKQAENRSLLLALGKMNFGDIFYYGWTANYAQYRESYDGFLESAAQNWQKIVDRQVKRLRNK